MRCREPHGSTSPYGASSSMRMLNSPPPCQTRPCISPRQSQCKDQGAARQSRPSLESEFQCSTTASQSQRPHGESVDGSESLGVSERGELIAAESRSPVAIALDEQLSPSWSVASSHCSDGGSFGAASSSSRRPNNLKRPSMVDRSPNGWMTPDSLKDRGMGLPFQRAAGICTFVADVSVEARNMCLCPTPELHKNTASSSEDAVFSAASSPAAPKPRAKTFADLVEGVPSPQQMPPQQSPLPRHYDARPRAPSLWNRLADDERAQMRPAISTAIPPAWLVSEPYRTSSAFVRGDSLVSSDPLLLDLSCRLSEVGLDITDLPHSEAELVEVLVEVGYSSAVQRSKVRKSIAAVQLVAPGSDVLNTSV